MLQIHLIWALRWMYMGLLLKSLLKLYQTIDFKWVRISSSLKNFLNDAGVTKCYFCIFCSPMTKIWKFFQVITFGSLITLFLENFRAQFEIFKKLLRKNEFTSFSNVSITYNIFVHVLKLSFFAFSGKILTFLLISFRVNLRQTSRPLDF